MNKFNNFQNFQIPPDKELETSHEIFLFTKGEKSFFLFSPTCILTHQVTKIFDV